MEFENMLALIKAVSESELTGFKYEEDGLKLHLTKNKGKAGIAAEGRANHNQAGDTFLPEKEIPDAVSESSDNTEKAGGGVNKLSGNIMESPLVGTFYTAPSEEAEPFVSVGDTVEKGQTLAIVEAMKLMNEIESEYDGVVKEIFAENGQSVEYGQPLFKIG